MEDWEKMEGIKGKGKKIKREKNENLGEIIQKNQY